MDFIAGIDGGGTKTTLVYQTLTGETLGRETFGPFNLNGTEEAAFAALLRQIAVSLGEKGRCLSLCIGAAGVSNPRLGELVAAALERADVARWEIVGDHAIALHGALEGGPGCALIAGTGSICLGRNDWGQTARAGGWGHLIGDEGSGYAMGRDALTAVARAQDGWGSATVLRSLLAEEKGLSTREDIIGYAYEGGKSRIAALAPLVERAASEGDAVAAGIIAQNAGALAHMAKAVSDRLALSRGEVALMGGLMSHDTLLRRETAEKITEMTALRCIPPRRTAAEGAVLMARQLLER